MLPKKNKRWNSFSATNKFDFTTNYFHACDVPLATNNNFITLRVTDRAGNTSTTNFNVILDYTTATNPPLVKLIWPLDGMVVSGSNITIRGTMSDETGSLLATVVNGDGTTNVLEGLIERNHVFWVENVPLNGTNHITLQATDAAGNVTVTNFTLNPSSLQLQITSTPNGDALYQSVGTVAGTVSVADAPVTVNGVAAVVAAAANADGSHAWSATDVPVRGEGTAMFMAQAAPASGSAANTAQAVERGPYLAVMLHTSATGVEQINPDGSWNNQGHGKVFLTSVTGSGADWQVTATGLAIRGSKGSGNGFSYDSRIMFYWSSATGSAETRRRHDIYSDSSGTAYDLWYPYFVDTDYSLRSVPDNELWAEGGGGYQASFIGNYSCRRLKNEWKTGVTPDITRTIWQQYGAKTSTKIFTGGKSGVNRQSLFCVQVEATEYDWGKDGGWVGCPWLPVNPAKLRALGKTPGADGKIWVALDDNAARLLNLTASGVKHYNAKPLNTEGVTKYPLHIQANTFNLEDKNIKAEFCVGQRVNFSLAGLPGEVVLSDLQGHWTLPGKYVNHKWQHERWIATFGGEGTTGNDPAGYYENYGSINYDIVSSLLENTANTFCWFVNKPGGDVSVSLSLKFDNGQTASVLASGAVDIFRPEVQFISAKKPSYLLTPLSIGSVFFIDTIQIKHEKHPEGKYPGLQLIKPNYSFDYGCSPTHSKSMSASEFYLDGNSSLGKENCYTNNCLGSNDDYQFLSFYDRAIIPAPVPFASYADCDEQLIFYIMFDPGGNDSIAVTIASVEWNWHGIINYSTGSRCNSSGAWIDSSLPTDFKINYNDDTFPTWEQVYAP